MSSLGSERSRSALTVDGAPAIELLLTPGDDKWVTRLVVAGAGDSAYFIEMGCPKIFDGTCALRFSEILEGIRLGDR